MTGAGGRSEHRRQKAGVGSGFGRARPKPLGSPSGDLAYCQGVLSHRAGSVLLFQVTTSDPFGVGPRALLSAAIGLGPFRVTPPSPRRRTRAVGRLNMACPQMCVRALSSGAATGTSSRHGARPRSSPRMRDDPQASAWSRGRPGKLRRFRRDARELLLGLSCLRHQIDGLRRCLACGRRQRRPCHGLWPLGAYPLAHTSSWRWWRCSSPKSATSGAARGPLGRQRRTGCVVRG